MENSYQTAISRWVLRVLQAIRRDSRRARQSGVFHIGISNFLTRSFNTAQRILLARILGAENIGHIGVVTSCLALIRLPAGAGAFTVVNKLVAENTGNEDAQRQVVGTSLMMNILTSMIVGLVAWWILDRTEMISDKTANQLLRILVFLLPPMILFEVLRSALMGQRRMKEIAKIDILLSSIEIFFVVPMAYFWSLNGWLFNRILIILSGFTLLSWLLRPVLGFGWKPEVARRLFTIGSFAFLGQVVGTIILQFDTLSLSGILKDPAVTGIYNTAAVIAQQMMIVPGAVLVVVFPFVAQNKDDMLLLKDRYWEFFWKIGFLSGSVAIVASALCPWFFPIFGPEFAASAAPFRVLSLGFIARSLYVLNNTYLDALGRTDITFVSGLLAAGMNIGLNLFTIPRWGMMAAAWATTGSMFFSLIIRQSAMHYFIFYKQAVK